MSLQSIKKELPDFYEAFLPDFFDKEIPVETFATCTHCAMVCHDEKKKIQDKKYYSNDTKCCTYFPKLPNYLVGAILSDNDPLLEEGRKRVRQKIKERTGVSPAGIYPSKKYEYQYLQQSAKFGSNEALLCPYFNQELRNCTIWKYREAACTTFYCRNVGASAGKNFWSSLCNYLVYFQNILVNYALQEEKYSSEDIFHTFPGLSINYNGSMTDEEREGQPTSEEVYKERWKHWYGREETFFIQSFKMIRHLDSQKLEHLSGTNGKINLKDLMNKWAQLMTIPELLKLNPNLPMRENESGQVLISFLDLDTSFAIPSLIFHQFNGRTNLADIKHMLEKDHNIEIDDEFILPFYQRDVLLESNKDSH